MRSELTDLFQLDPALIHLNHGSYGTVPVAVREAANAWRVRAESDPMTFHEKPLVQALAGAREAGARFLGLDPGEMALVRNATEAANTILRFVADAGEVRSGSQIVLNSHSYGAVRLAAEQIAGLTGARVAEVDFGVDASAADVVSAYEAALGEPTALVVVDQVTSPTAMVLPVEDVAAMASQRGIPVLVDAAHVPGQLDVGGRSGSPELALPDIAASGATFWFGNFHKWALTARGTTGLWVDPAWRDRARPLVTSWGSTAAYPARFDELGAEDQAGWLSLDTGLEVWRELGGWTMVSEAATRVVDGAARITAVLGELGAPDDAPLPVRPAPLMRLVALPPGVATDPAGIEELQDALHARGIVVKATTHAGQGYLRLSGHATISARDYDVLAEALPGVLPRA